MQCHTRAGVIPVALRSLQWQNGVPSRPCPKRCSICAAASSLIGASATAHLRASLVAGFVPQVCFSKACQDNADSLFLLALAIPLVTAVIAIAWILRPVPKELEDANQVFRDPETGIVFESPEGAAPERDAKGELAWQVISYTPYPAKEGVEGDRVRIDVGPIGAQGPRTFLFEKRLPDPSQLITITLPRPLGIVFEEDARRGRAVVADVVEGSRASQLLQLSKFDRTKLCSAPLPGDVLRACTATNLVYPAKSLLLGMKPPQRTIVVYGADDQKWPKVANALKQGLAADGPVTLVLERRLDRSGQPLELQSVEESV